MQGRDGGKLGMPQVTDKVKRLLLPALQLHDKYAVRSTASPQATKKGTRLNLKCAHDMHTTM